LSARLRDAGALLEALGSTEAALSDISSAVMIGFLDVELKLTIKLYPKFRSCSLDIWVVLVLMGPLIDFYFERST